MMTTQPETEEGQRIEYAPTACGPDDSSGMISVVVGEDEDVRWYWSHYPGGRSVVTGYEIIKKDPVAEGGEFSFERAVADLLWGGGEGKEHEPRRPESAPRESVTRAHNTVGFLSSISQRAG